MSGNDKKLDVSIDSWNEWDIYSSKMAKKSAEVFAKEEKYGMGITSQVVKRYKPIKPLARQLLELPSKTIFTTPELLEPYTNIAINPIEEVIDLDELRKYGRYAIIEQDTDYKKEFVISDNITPIKEIVNPDYERIEKYNHEIEKANKIELDRYNVEISGVNNEATYSLGDNIKQVRPSELDNSIGRKKVRGTRKKKYEASVSHWETGPEPAVDDYPYPDSYQKKPEHDE